jgi:hypothetical protein
VVGLDAALTKVGADGAELLLHARTEALVEHSLRRYQRAFQTSEIPYGSKTL